MLTYRGTSILAAWKSFVIACLSGSGKRAINASASCGRFASWKPLTTPRAARGHHGSAVLLETHATTLSGSFCVHASITAAKPGGAISPGKLGSPATQSKAAFGSSYAQALAV